MVAAAEADVVLLPELFATGFTLDPAEWPKGPAGGRHGLRRWTARYGKAVAAASPLPKTDVFYNRMYFVKPSGEFIGYDKRHLFAPGGEARQYTPAVAVRWSNTEACGSCCSSVTICVFRSGAVAGAITTRFCAALRGLRRGAKCGGRCCAPGPSKTSAMRPGRIGWGMTCGPLRRGFGVGRLQGPHDGRSRRRGTNSDGRVRHGGAGGVPRKIPRVAGCRRIRFEIDVSCARGTPMLLFFPSGDYFR